MLQHRESTHELRQYAHDYVRAWLARSRYGLNQWANGLPAVWTPEGLRPWLLDQHDRHDEAFNSDDGEVVTKEELCSSHR
ncbi:hypothetical protein [Lentzea flava]|uniref:Uncharacterized protein n=1 Tax=Lentzea flava TaxID=103732 RepID=A0ABQ2VHF1_9PSEU|nr:hypothetical protein [Lentzea flava]MCP2205190.1 hypothetical protein [Lentzea flava]GGU84574.1 hypothetical protein GCM10010178_88580 [Lentzea flava]